MAVWTEMGKIQVVTGLDVGREEREEGKFEGAGGTLNLMRTNVTTVVKINFFNAIHVYRGFRGS